jgi:hypothetical protein
VSDVIEQVEVVVVDPDRMSGKRNPSEFLPEARRSLQGCLGEFEDAIELETAILTDQRPGFEDPHRADVHVDAWRLEVQEGTIESGESIGMCVGHGNFSFVARWG